MKNTRQLPWIVWIAGVLLMLSTTSCSNLFWTPEQKVPPRLKGTMALRPELAENVASGRWHTSLHLEDGDTVAHRWEGRNLVFEKSSDRLILMVWDNENQVVRGHRLFLTDRRFLKRTTPFSWKDLFTPGEKYAYQPFGTAISLGIINLAVGVSPNPPSELILLIPVGIVTDIATGIIGEVRTVKDPRRRKTLIRILPLNDDPDWLPTATDAE